MSDDKAIILCVDDEQVPLMLRKLVLERAGYEVITAGSAMQAREIVASRPVTLVLSDHLMPGSTGTELAREIKASRPELPVILYSGVNEVPGDAGCVDLFLSKVAGPAVLCDHISAVLANAKKRKQEEAGTSESERRERAQ
jgi:DNA-binding NtrC family response regulator